MGALRCTCLVGAHCLRRRESDFYTKQQVRFFGPDAGWCTNHAWWRCAQEFQAWLRDVKGVVDAGMAKREVMELFKTYMEDFNTATLPHEKWAAPGLLRALLPFAHDCVWGGCPQVL